MHLLLTNDDGINCHFLHRLAAGLAAAGHDLAIAAPRREQSWIGSAKSRHNPVHVERITHPDLPDLPAWSIIGTPSDCVAIALQHLLPAINWPRPDAVVSGINVGYNMSLGFILASGTIGGAWEAAVHGLPAVACSQILPLETFAAWHDSGQRPTPDLTSLLDISAAHTARLLPDLVAASPAEGFVVHNLNFPNPCAATTEVRLTVPARVRVNGLFGPADADSNHHFHYNAGADFSATAPLTDRAAIAAGHISHTVLDYRVLGNP